MELMTVFGIIFKYKNSLILTKVLKKEIFICQFKTFIFILILYKFVILMIIINIVLFKRKVIIISQNFSN